MRNQSNNTYSNRRGMTMIEMLVAVAILSLIILAFGTILTQAQKVVKTSQTNMRTNGTAAAIAQVIRQDLRQITQNGFLCITQTNGTTNSVPRLLFTTTGTTNSKTSDFTSQYGIPVYGTIDNQLGTSSEYADLTTGRCLVRQKWILDPDSTGSGGIDVWEGYGLTYIQGRSRKQLNDEFIGIDEDNSNSLLLYAFPKDDATAGLYVPPRNETDLGRLWQVLSNETSRLSIMWTDGTTTGGVLNWYGILYNDVNSDGSSPTDRKIVPSPLGSAWNTSTIDTIAANEFEFNVPDIPSAGDNNYRALWTHHDQSNWPKAIRISFVLYDEAMAEEMQLESGSTNEEIRSKRYEVISPIGR